MATRSDPFINRGIPKDLFMEIQEGRVPGHRIRHKFGRVDNISGISGLTTIACGQSGIIPKMSTPGPFYFNSDSPLDDLGNTGAEAIFVEGIDEDFIRRSEIVELDGTNLVQTARTNYIGFLPRIEGTHPTGGDYPLFTSRTAEGTIFSYMDAGGTIQQTRICPINGESNNQSLIAADFIPAEETAFFYSFWYGTSEGKSAQILFRQQRFGEVMLSKNVFDLFESPLTHKHIAPGKIPEKTLIEFQAISSAAGVGVTASFEMVIVQNEYLGLKLAG